MLTSVVFRTPSLADVANILLKLEAQGSAESILPWRRRSRIRRTLHKLRSIRRTAARTFIQYYRVDTDIYVELASEQHVTLFLLMWPGDLPQWLRV